MELKHFAHEHTLIFEESEEIRHCCNACGVYVLLSPCYMCTTQGCNFYLHQACAQLPSTLHHYYCGDDDIYDSFVEVHDLALFAKPQMENCLCGKCGKLCENFTYHCPKCEFVLHPLCGVSLDIQIKHESHPQHPMALLCCKAMFPCNVCRRADIMDYFFSCHKCNFWIHQECVLLPSFVDVGEHRHYLSLVYSASFVLDLPFSSRSCLICAKIVVMDFGFYYCFVCRLISHVDCARSHMKNSGAIFHLPTAPNDMFPSSMIRTLVKERAVEEETSNMLEKYHAYSLVLINDTPLESVCNACIQPLSAPYYRSNSDQSNFNFLLHKFCVDLTPSIKDMVYGSEAIGKLVSPRLDEFFSLFRCYTCQKYCNGFGYQYGVTVDDLECSFSPKAIKHDSHRQHPLVLAESGAIQSWYSCCDKQSCSYGYHCGVCKFRIHTDCARLPEAVTHRFDKHPLTLTFTYSSQHHDEHFCEFCEKDIDSKYWFYHCAECDQSFHVDCIPSTGKFSKIKFGGTVKVPCHEDHPLTLTRMLNCGSQTCGYCHETVEGFEDGMALHCESCDFWIHFRCGCLSSGGVVSLPYLDMSQLREYEL